MGGTETVFSADTDNLNTFTDRGRRFEVALEAVMADIVVARQSAASAIGFGLGPPDISTGSLQELLAEASINTAYVADLSRSLSDPTAVSAVESIGLVTGYVIDGTDHSLGRDMDMLALLRAQPLEQAGLAPEVVERLAATAEGQHAAAALLAAGVPGDALVDATTEQIITVAQFAREREGESGRSHELAPGHLTPGHAAPDNLVALLTGGYRPGLRQAILNGEVAPPDGEVRDLVVDAMVAGVAPQDVGIAAVYFPTFYLGDLALRERISDAKQHREGVDGSSWLWFDHDPDELAAVDREIDHLSTRRQDFASARGIGDDGSVGYWDAVAATSDSTAGSAWEGLAYGLHFNGFHDSRVTPGGQLMDPFGFAVQLGRIGNRLADDPVAAAAFFNRVGVHRTANLPTFLDANELGREVFDNYSLALAGASRTAAIAGEIDRGTALVFSGEDLMNQPPSAAMDGVVWYSPALLFTAGTFEPTFLAEATMEALLLAENGDSHGYSTLVGPHGTAGESNAMTFTGGEDPRNILLARTTTDPAAVDRLMALLISPPRRSEDQSPGPALDLLLHPHVPFSPAGTNRLPHHRVPALDASRQDVEVVSRSGDNMAYPELNSEYPIADFLAVVAADDVHAGAVLSYVGDTAASRGPVLKDPGTAVGVDLILAQHATVMMTAPDLAAAGIERSTLNDNARVPVTQKQWRAAYNEVLRLGRGQALAVAADQLLGMAVAAAVDASGWFRSEVVIPFAALAGRATEEAAEALVAYSAGLDDWARDWNRNANLAASLSFSAFGLMPLLGLPASVSSASWGWFYNGYPTDNELRARIELAEVSEWQTGLTWEDRIARQHLQALTGPTGRGEIDVMLPDGGTTVPLQGIREVDDTVIYQWRHPGSGQWEVVPLPSDAGFEALFGSTGAGETTDTWLTVAESRDLIDDYRGLTGDVEWIDAWLGVGCRAR